MWLLIAYIKLLIARLNFAQLVYQVLTNQCLSKVVLTLKSVQKGKTYVSSLRSNGEN